MNPIEQLKIMANSSYVILKDGMTIEEIEKLKRAAPKNPFFPRFIKKYLLLFILEKENCLSKKKR